MEERVTRSGQSERRDHTPPGRLRRIFHDYHGAVWAMVGAATLMVLLFVASAAWAVGGATAALAGVLLAAVTNLNPYTLSLEVLP